MSNGIQRGVNNFVIPTTSR